MTWPLPFLIVEVWSVCNDFYRHVFVFVSYESLAVHATLQFSHKPFRFVRLSHSEACTILPFNLRHFYNKSVKNVS